MKLKQKTQMNVYVVNELRSDLKNIRYEIVLMMDKAHRGPEQEGGLTN